MVSGVICFVAENPVRAVASTTITWLSKWYKEVSASKPTHPATCKERKEKTLIRRGETELYRLRLSPTHGVGRPGVEQETVQAIWTAGQVDGSAHLERDARQPQRGRLQVDRGEGRGRGVREQFLNVRHK